MVGVIIIISALRSGFEWYHFQEYRQGNYPGPASIVAIVGVAMILAVGRAMPRILENGIFRTNDAQFWRNAVVASFLWIGTLIIISAVSSDFEWIHTNYNDKLEGIIEGYFNFGPASIVAIVGVAMIFVVFLGVPRIFEDTDIPPKP